mmetsp:Transcript_10514/g.24911  ORF Transcript_10514/g.24911 Transcript_10514/m.24911 type:complete len:214 (+) Transcript_10514:241-882(+)
MASCSFELWRKNPAPVDAADSVIVVIDQRHQQRNVVELLQLSHVHSQRRTKWFVTPDQNAFQLCHFSSPQIVQRLREFVFKLLQLFPHVPGVRCRGREIFESAEGFPRASMQLVVRIQKDIGKKVRMPLSEIRSVPVTFETDFDHVPVCQCRSHCSLVPEVAFFVPGTLFVQSDGRRLFFREQLFVLLNLRILLHQLSILPHHCLCGVQKLQS